MNEKTLDRRTFISRATAAGVGMGFIGAAGYLKAEETPAAKIVPAGQRLTVAVIGTNSRGLSHVESLTGIPGVEITHICDVEDKARQKGINETAKRQTNKPKGVVDFRDVLADKSVDAVTMATPDHWHTPMAIMALAAGKHVYLEKPCSHNFQEGEMLIKAVAKSGKVFQMGNQRRSFPNVQAVIRLIHGGLIGKAYLGRAWYANTRKPIGTGKVAEVPKSLNYDLWQGPAPHLPYKDNLVPYNWHWFWHWGTGEALNNGTHEVDVCRWALNADFPERVSSNGGRYSISEGDWETPDTQIISWDFASGSSLTWEGRSCNGYQSEKLGRGCVIHGTEGSVLIDGDNYTHYDIKGKLVKAVKSSFAGGDAGNTFSASGPELDRLHVRNFVDAIRTGSPVNSPIEEAHKSVALLHLGNIAWRVKRELHCENATGHILGDSEAAKLSHRKYEPGWEPKV